jgi:hypothetical protein
MKQSTMAVGCVAEETAHLLRANKRERGKERRRGRETDREREREESRQTSRG